MTDISPLHALYVKGAADEAQRRGIHEMDVQGNLSVLNEAGLAEVAATSWDEGFRAARANGSWADNPYRSTQ